MLSGLARWVGLILVAAGALGAAAAPAQEVGAIGVEAAETGLAAGDDEEVNPEWEAAKLAVLSELEELRGDIHMLSVLRLLQERLFEWNEALIASGKGLVFLNPGLCAQEEIKVWCELLPVSFGRAEVKG